MKTNLLLFLLLILSIGYQSNAQVTSKKCLVVYFSHTGNTREMANQIKELTNADIFEIQPVDVYPADHKTVVEQGKREVNSNFKPKLKTKIANINQYDLIFVGSPNWWNSIAPPVATFLTSYDFSGKTIIPFITHKGSRMGNSEADIKALCPNSTMLKGLPMRGSSVKDAKPEVSRWLRNLKVIE